MPLSDIATAIEQKKITSITIASTARGGIFASVQTTEYGAWNSTVQPTVDAAVDHALGKIPKVDLSDL